MFASVERYLTERLKLQGQSREESRLQDRWRRVCRLRLSRLRRTDSGESQEDQHVQTASSERSSIVIGVSRWRSRLNELRLYLRGWIDYFILEQRKSLARELDKWLRRRVRACYWKTWRLPRTRVRKLKSFGVPHDEAMSYGNSRKGPWRMSMVSAVQRSLSNDWLASQGLFSLEERWSELAPKRRTA